MERGRSHSEPASYPPLRVAAAAMLRGRDSAPGPNNARSSLQSKAARYFAKWKGDAASNPGMREIKSYISVASFGAFVSIGFVSCIGFLTTQKLLTPIGSMGAQAVLVFAMPQSPFSQPRNTIGGQLIATVIGTICRLHIAVPMQTKVLAMPLSVSLTLFFQLLFRCVNPPAGGTAAILVISDPDIDAIGWGVLLPVLLESCIMIFVACLIINLHPLRSYPKYWIWGKEASSFRSRFYFKKERSRETAQQGSADVAQSSTQQTLAKI